MCDSTYLRSLGQSSAETEPKVGAPCTSREEGLQGVEKFWAWMMVQLKIVSIVIMVMIYIVLTVY